MSNIGFDWFPSYLPLQGQYASERRTRKNLNTAGSHIGSRRAVLYNMQSDEQRSLSWHNFVNQPY